MILGVKIKNRKTGKFRHKGYGTWWDDKGSTWSSLSGAKLAICPTNYDDSYLEYMKNKEELDSDFMIINDDGNIEYEPIIDYMIDYLKRKRIDSNYSYDKLIEFLIEYRRNI